MVMFWFGISQPDNDTKTKIYESLGETNDSLFPIKFNSVLPMADDSRLSGQIDGFMWINLSDDSIIIEK